MDLPPVAAVEGGAPVPVVAIVVPVVAWASIVIAGPLGISVGLGLALGNDMGGTGGLGNIPKRKSREVTIKQLPVND